MNYYKFIDNEGMYYALSSSEGTTANAERATIVEAENDVAALEKVVERSGSDFEHFDCIEVTIDDECDMIFRTY